MKGKKDAIGTVRNGRKKVAEDKWVSIPKTGVSERQKKALIHLLRVKGQTETGRIIPVSVAKQLEKKGLVSLDREESSYRTGSRSSTGIWGSDTRSVKNIKHSVSLTSEGVHHANGYWNEVISELNSPDNVSANSRDSIDRHIEELKTYLKEHGIEKTEKSLNQILDRFV